MVDHDKLARARQFAARTLMRTDCGLEDVTRALLTFAAEEILREQKLQVRSQEVLRLVNAEEAIPEARRAMHVARQLMDTGTEEHKLAETFIMARDALDVAIKAIGEKRSA